jgi:hypothetical protein
MIPDDQRFWASVFEAEKALKAKKPKKATKPNKSSDKRQK